jgi:thiol-disulfide isomerase/thioredoxin
MQAADASQAEQIFERSSRLAESLTKQAPNSNVINAYIAIASGYISRSARSAPDSASKALDSVKTFFDGIESQDASVTKAVEGFLKNTKNMERTIESAKRLLSMIGQPAPEIDPMEWINGEPLSTLADLKGKVVLVDFWAVWCGPCIATFPHLKHLDEQYKDKGLTIMGVTRQYNMRWDDSTGNYARSQTPVELEDEMNMLEKFIAKHQLTHRTMVTPEKSDMQERYAVTGIPHAVLIDKQGIVRLVKVGSGSQNAEEIESMIKKLLDE